MHPVRIGIIGSGFMATTHGVSIRRYLQNAVLTGIAGGSRARDLAAEMQTQAYPAVEELVCSRDIDAVIITSPHHLHHRHALMCAKNGKHALIEKPMATSVHLCAELIEKFTANRLQLMIAFTQRYRESNMRAHELLRSGTLGKIIMAQEWGLVPGGLASYPAWQLDAENLGLLFGYGIHNLDKLRWFLESEVEYVHAKTLQLHTGIETSTMATLCFKNGVLVSLWTGVDLPRPCFQGGAFRSFVVCEHGLLDVDGYGPVKVSRHEQEWETLFVQPPVDWKGEGKYAPARMAYFNAQNQDFIDSILNNTPPPVTGHDGLKSVEIALAIYQSARENRAVTL